MIVTSPWPVPSANADLAEFTSDVAATHLPDVIAETDTSSPSQLEKLVCWTLRERLRLCWFRCLLTTGLRNRCS